MTPDNDHRDEAPHCHCHRCECHTHGEKDAAAKMFHLAKCAKHSLLKQKIERQLEAKIGPKLDRIAALAADALIDNMHRISGKKQASHRYEEDLLAAIRSD